MKKKKKPRAILGAPLPRPSGGGYHKHRAVKREKNALRRIMEIE